MKHKIAVIVSTLFMTLSMIACGSFKRLIP